MKTQMAKIYKLTESQVRELKTYLTDKKNLTESAESASPEATSYYSQNPEAKAEKEKREAEEAAKAQEETSQNQLSETDPQITQTVVDVLKQMGLTPDDVNPAVPAAAPQGNTSATQLPSPTPTSTVQSSASSAPTTSQPITSQPAHSKDSTVSLQANSGGPVPAPTGGEGEIHEDQPVPSTEPLLSEDMDDDLVFTTPLSNMEVDIWGKSLLVPDSGYSDDELDVSGDLSVVWRLGIEGRSWGIKDLSVSILDIKGVINVSHFEDRGFEKQVEFNSEGWEVVSDVTIGSQIRPNNIELNFKTKTITVN